MTNYTQQAGTGAVTVNGQPSTARILSNLTLNPAGPFHQFVLTYLAASAGLTPVYDAINYPDFMANTSGVLPGVTGNDARADLGEVVRQARAAVLTARQAEQSLCCMLANIAYESIKKADRDRLKGNPVFEFFRCVRNAASHSNLWHFRHGHPKDRGQWRGFLIDETLKGNTNPLQGQVCFYGTLQPADLLYLLQDVEGLL